MREAINWVSMSHWSVRRKLRPCCSVEGLSLFYEKSTAVQSAYNVCTLSFTIFSKIFNAFERLFMLPEAAFFFFFLNTGKTVILWNIITISKKCFLFEYILKCDLFLWCKAEFSASLPQSLVSHDPVEITVICWFTAQETFVLLYFIIMLKKVVQLHIFV